MTVFPDLREGTTAEVVVGDSIETMERRVLEVAAAQVRELREFMTPGNVFIVRIGVTNER